MNILAIDISQKIKSKNNFKTVPHSTHIYPFLSDIIKGINQKTNMGGFMTDNNNQNITYASVNQILENAKYPFTKGQIHYFLTNRHKNGLEESIRKIGKRIYFRIDLFDLWIEKQAKVTNEGENGTV
jgi:hypothetical protein